MKVEQPDVPIRTCLGCGRRRPKAELVRLVLDASGQPTTESGRAIQARGAYLCGPGCLKAAVKRKAFGRAFKGRARSVDPERLWVALGGEVGGWR
ncbi:MAG: YlxR family protein [Myxococcaceae bacterium]|nr:YlxR family protein [Myxococcaceae bacterium]